MEAQEQVWSISMVLWNKKESMVHLHHSAAVWLKANYENSLSLSSHLSMMRLMTPFPHEADGTIRWCNLVTKSREYSLTRVGHSKTISLFSSYFHCPVPQTFPAFVLFLDSGVVRVLGPLATCWGFTSQARRKPATKSEKQGTITPNKRDIYIYFSGYKRYHKNIICSMHPHY